MTDKAEEKVEKKVESQAAKRKIEFSNPFILKTVTLNTTPAQLAFSDTFDSCAVSLRNLSAVLPAVVRNQSEMMAVNGAVEHLINNAMADLRKEAAQIKKIAEDNGIEMGKLSYTNAVSVDAKLTCHKAGQYLQFIMEMDELICLVHSAWFAGFIQDDAKSSIERKWRRKAISVAAEIKGITNRAFNKARNNRTMEEDMGLADNQKDTDADGADSAASTAKPDELE